MAKETILWIGDNKEALSTYEPRFRSQGWQVVLAFSTNEGKAFGQAIKPSLIIMDIMTAGERGYAAIKDLRSTPVLEGVPIIVFSRTSSMRGDAKALRLDGLLSEADELVDRSENPDVLLNAVRRCLRTQAV
jgi:DNA-binding response OmpR family regulator